MTLQKLKALMRQKGLKHYVLPKHDEFMNHNLPAARDRLRSLTGFTGSSGYTIVNSEDSEKSLFVTDSRYELQAGIQIDATKFEVSTDATSLSKKVETLQGDIGIDGNLFPASQIQALKSLKNAGQIKVNNEAILLDQVQPVASATPQVNFFQHSVQYSGLSTADKLTKIYTKMDAIGVEALHVAILEEVAWTLNIRASGQHEFDPLFNSFLLLRKQGNILFLQEGLIDLFDKSMLDQNTRVASIANFKQEIEGLDLGRVGYDGSSCSELQY